MNTGLEFNMCKLPTSFALNSEIEDLPKRVEEYISLGLHYACLATAQHLQSILQPSTMMNQLLNTTVFLPAGIAFAVLVYMSTGLAFLFRAA
jgi:hypothetical protein